MRSLTAAVCLAVFLGSGAVPADTVVVDNGNVGSSNWTMVNMNTASQQGVDGPGTPPLGTGSWEFSTGSGTGTGQGGKPYLYFNAVDFLSQPVYANQVTQFGYDTYIVSRQSGTSVAPALNIRYDLDGDEDPNSDGDAWLIFEPANNGHLPGDVGVWQSWDAATGNWWSPAPALGGGASNVQLPNLPNRMWSLSILAGQSSGGFWADAVGNFDNVTVELGDQGAIFAERTYDFEAGEPIPEPATVVHLVGLGLAAAVLGHRRRRKSA